MKVTRLQVNALWATIFLFLYALASLGAVVYLATYKGNLTLSEELLTLIYPVIVGMSGTSMGAIVWIAKHFAADNHNGNHAPKDNDKPGG